MSVTEKFSAIRKGLLEFLILRIVSGDKVYVADMLKRLGTTEFATQEGTIRFAGRFGTARDRGFYGSFDGLELSTLGLGTYLGDPDDRTDVAYRDAVIAAVRGGINCLDTAINYRYQRSERSIGPGAQNP